MIECGVHGVFTRYSRHVTSIDSPRSQPRSVNTGLCTYTRCLRRGRAGGGGGGEVGGWRGELEV